MSSLRIILAASALLFSLSNAAIAADPKYVVEGPGKQPITDSKFGNCVQTKWDSPSDPCAPAQVAAPVVEAPAPAPAPVPQPAAALTNEELTLLFDFNKSILTPTDKTKLDNISDAVNKSPKVIKVAIVGYTDQIGTDSYNTKLSIARAKAVKAYLDKSTRIPADVVGLRGLGKQDPVTSGCKKLKNRKKEIACMARDRRVEVEFDFEK